MTHDVKFLTAVDGQHQEAAFSLLVSNDNRKVKVLSAEQTTTKIKPFPFKKVPRGVVLDASKIDNPLAVNRIVNPKITKLTESVDNLYNTNPRIRSLIDDLVKQMKESGKAPFDINKVGKCVDAPIGLSTFNGITQRILDPDHVANILENMKEELLSPVFATTTATDGTRPVFDSMHCSNIVGLTAKFGLWGNDPKNWENFTFPFFVIVNTDPFFADEAAFHRNGKGQKPWKPYDYYRIKVANVRRGKANKQLTTDPDYILAERIQTMCELLEAFPLPEKHPQYGQAGTMTRVGDLINWAHISRAHDLDDLAIPEFMLTTHKKYWHGTVCDSAMFGLYGHLFLQMKNSNINMKDKDWETFLDRFHATIKTCFTNLEVLRTKVDTAHNIWFQKANPILAAKSKKKKVDCPHDVALSVVLKIMKYVGEIHPTVDCNVGLSYTKDKYNILDNVLELDDNSIKNIIEDAI
jgi:hypothetical protein